MSADDCERRIASPSSRPRSGASAGKYYRVLFPGCTVLIEDTWNPEFEACRALVARGITGRLETWCAGKTHPGLIFPDIEEGARWTVVENDKEGPAIKRWEPFPEHLGQDAVSSRRVLAPAAGIDRGVG